MKAVLSSPRVLLGLSGAVAALAAVVWLAVGGSLADSATAMRPSHPRLFDTIPKCTTNALTLRRARRLEQQGYLRAERYPYDARDGIRAVLRLLEAQSCYRTVGKEEEANRISRRASELTARLDVDYASARLVLDTALAAENWSVAHVELSRLLALTEHLNGHAYVEWLKAVAGRIAADVHRSP